MSKASSNTQRASKKGIPWRQWLFSPTAIIRLSVLTGIPALLGLWGRFHWFLDLFNHFQAQYFVALLLAAVVLLFSKRKRLALVPGLLLLVPALRLAPLYLPASSPPDGPSLKVVAFNVQGSNDRYAETIAWILKTDPDFIYLPECNPDWAKALKPLDEVYPHAADFPILGNIGHCFRSKYPITDKQIMVKGKIKVPLLKVVIKMPQGEVTVFGAHPVPPVSEFWASEQDVYLASLTEMSTAIDGPALIIGDLNATRWSARLTEILKHYDDSADGRGFRATWMRENWLLSIPIDHVFHRGFRGVKSREVGPNIGSDHRAVVAELVW
ncbi:MAG: endonuclease/exonuclease/phosphatase family protein [Verrucomicrobiota bacterium]